MKKQKIYWLGFCLQKPIYERFCFQSKHLALSRKVVNNIKLNSILSYFSKNRKWITQLLLPTLQLARELAKRFWFAASYIDFQMRRNWQKLTLKLLIYCLMSKKDMHNNNTCFNQLLKALRCDV